MRSPYAQPAEPPKRQAPSGLIRALVVLYWTASLGFGLWRLREAGWAAEAMQPVLRTWYVEALAFLTVWGGVVGILGLTRGGKSARPRRQPRTRAATMRSPLERDRVR